MKDKKFLFFLLLSIVVGSCQGDYGTTEEIAECYEKKGITFDKEVECCVVLPEVGCEGCIAAGVQLFLDNKKSFLKTQKKNQIVFTMVNSLKMLLRTLELSSLEDFNCHLDLKNDYLVAGKNSIYPLILHLKDGKITKAEFQSPYSNDVIGQLYKELAE